MPKQLLQASGAGEELRFRQHSGLRAALGVLGLMLVVSACSPTGQAPTPTPSGAAATDLPTTSALASPAATPAGTRTAEITELHNDVTSRARPEDEFESASLGYLFRVGGGVRTGEESRVRIDTSDGSIVRIASHTEFQLLELSPQTADPVTRIGLAEGRLWVWVTQALGLGTLEIETPTAIATVRGSLMSVAFNSASGQMTVTCLEGICRLTDSAGRFSDLQAAEYSEIPAEGQPPTPPAAMTGEQLADWTGNFPEATGVVAAVAARSAPTATQAPAPTAVVTGTASPTAASVDCNLRSVTSAETSEITFDNQSARTVKVFWVDWNGQEVLYSELRPGQSYPQATFVTHAWCVRDAGSGEALLAITATGPAHRAVIP